MTEIFKTYLQHMFLNNYVVFTFSIIVRYHRIKTKTRTVNLEYHQKKYGRQRQVELLIICIGASCHYRHLHCIGFISFEKIKNNLYHQQEANVLLYTEPSKCWTQSFHVMSVFGGYFFVIQENNIDILSKSPPCQNLWSSSRFQMGCDCMVLYICG